MTTCTDSNNNNTTTNTTKKKLVVSLLDYGAGNVRSVRNAIFENGYDIIDITSPEQILNADVIIFPGVGSYASAMKVLQDKNYIIPLQQYLQDATRPFLGICLGMQTLFESSEEIIGPNTSTGSSNTDVETETTIEETTTETTKTIQGLGIIPGHVIKFNEKHMIVPHIGWNGRTIHQSNSPVLQYVNDNENVYFVHSYYVPITNDNKSYILTSTTYNHQRFISSIQKNCIIATQFHPEKSSTTGLNIIKGFLQAAENGTLGTSKLIENINIDKLPPTKLTKRIVVALDVRSNDDGDLVVTKGDQYDVRESSSTTATSTEVTTTTTTANGKGKVRNLGKPVSLAHRYYKEGADEIAFLNITSFRSGVIEDMPMLLLLEEASKNIFIPLTVGGGIRSYTDPTTQQTWSALEVAARYFRAGADKVSMGSDAVHAAEAYIASGGKKTGTTSIEMISQVYGVQAVVISIDPKRVYVQSRDEVLNPRHVVVELDDDNCGPNGERMCWYQCTVKGGREERDICAVTVCTICELLGAGEIMLNCIDMDGQCKGYDIPLMTVVSNAVTIPVIASSGAGSAQHFVNVFQQTNVQAALAAGMFHRKEVEISTVKQTMIANDLPTRI